MNTFERAPRFQVAALLILVLLLVLVIGIKPVGAQDVEPTVEATSVPIVVTVTASEVPSDEGSVLITGDWLSVLQIGSTVFLLGGTLYAIQRTGKVTESLGGFVDRLSGNAALVTSLEQKFNRLKPNEQARLTKLIDILDPWTKTTVNPGDDKAVALLREISDGIPANAKSGADAQAIPRVSTDSSGSPTSGAVTAKTYVPSHYITPEEPQG